MDSDSLPLENALEREIQLLTLQPGLCPEAVLLIEAAMATQSGGLSLAEAVERLKLTT